MEAVQQVTARGHSVTEVAQRLAIYDDAQPVSLAGEVR